MLGLRKVAVTGGLSSGKSTVCQLFKDLGAYTVSADEIVHQLLSPITPLGKQLVNLLGHEVIKEGRFDRQRIADIVFQDAKLLKQFELLLHPLVMAEIKKQYLEIRKKLDAPLFVAEVPLLFESDNQDWFDAIITVDAPLRECLRRFQKEGKSEQEFHRRMQHQMKPQDKRERSHYILNNSGDIQALKRQLLQIFQELSSKRS